MRYLLPVLLLAGGALAPSASLGAQIHGVRPRVHEDFWWGGSVGAGHARRTCDQCPDPLETWGGSGTLQAGGAINEHLLVGGEFAGWYRRAAGIKTLIGNGSIAATWFPFYRNGFYLKGGAGFSIYQYRQNGATLKGVGPGFVGQVGYDIMVGKKTALAPFGGIWWGLPGALKRRKGGASTGVSPATGAKYTVLEAGLKLTFY